MDLSFIRTGLVARGLGPPNRMVRPVLPFLLAAAGAAQAASPTARAIANVLRGQDRGGDWVQALAHMFAPVAGGMIDAERLGGSFHPLMARRLAVGRER